MAQGRYAQARKDARDAFEEEPKAKETVSVQPKPPVIPEQSATSSIVTHVLTDVESNLLRMANEGDDFSWDDAMSAIELIDDYSILRDPFEIPAECRIRQEKNEWRFRWLDPYDADRFNMQTTGRFPWKVCNRLNAPWIPDKNRDENGFVRMGKMVLAMMRYDVYMARQTRIWKLSDTIQKKGEKSPGLELTGQEGGTFRGSDIVVAQETFDEATQQARVTNVNYRAGADRDSD